MTFLSRRHLVRSPDINEGGGGGGLLVPDPVAAPVTPSAAPIITTEQKADWNSENWKDFLEEDLKTDPSLKHIKDIPTAVKSYIHAQRMIGADKFLVPNKYATPDEWTNIYTKLGRPEAADKYDIKSEDGSLISPEFMKGFKEAAFKAGLNPQQATEFSNFYDKQVKDAQAQMIIYEDEQTNQEIGELKKEWGAAYDSKIKAAQVALKAFGGDEIMTYLKESGLDTNTKLARLFAKVGESLSEDQNDLGGATSNALTPMAADKELNGIMSNPAYFDKDHPDHERLVNYAVELRNWKKV